MINTDYNFYVEKYKGDMPVNEFEKCVYKAERIVENHILNNPTDGFESDVQFAICGVVDILNKYNKTNISSLKSESVGDYSRTFATSDEIESNQKNEIKEALRAYLLHTGLLYRGM